MGWALRFALLAAPVAVLAVLAWTHRWMADDGFINLRVVRQIEAGNGPVFNGGERVEAYTSAMWIGVLLVGDLLLPLRLEWVAVVLGIAGSIAGLALGTAGSVRLQRRRPSDRRLLVPFGALVILALYPMWFFASSGLEGGLVFGWLGACTFLLGTWAADRHRSVGLLGAAVLGLGWLIRPELALLSALFLVVGLAGQWDADRWARRLGTLAAGVALPVAYQVFRMGYFGSIVPNTALAKSAAGAEYRRGLTYLWDTVGTYTLWFPAVVVLGVGYGLVVAGGSSPGWRRPDRRTLVVGAFGIGGLVTAAYIVRVGGDYIHARLLLPSIFSLCAPVAVIAVDRRTTALAAVVTLLWAGVTAVASPGEAKYLITMDGRADLVTAEEVLGPSVAESWYRGGPLYWETSSLLYPPNSALRRPTVARLGVGAHAYVLGPGVDIYDEVGLADPITARFLVRRRTNPPGHEKPAPAAWSAARLTAPGARPRAEDFSVVLFTLIQPLVPIEDDADFAAQVSTVRRVLQCRPLRELRAATSDELTVGRFVRNLGWSIRKRSLAIPPVPVQAERELCQDG